MSSAAADGLPTMTITALDVEFTATLVQSPAKGGWTYV